MNNAKKLADALKPARISQIELDGLRGDLAFAQSERDKWERKYNSAIKVRDGLNVQLDKAYIYIDELRTELKKLKSD